MEPDADGGVVLEVAEEDGDGLEEDLLDAVVVGLGGGLLGGELVSGNYGRASTHEVYLRTLLRWDPGCWNTVNLQRIFWCNDNAPAES